MKDNIVCTIITADYFHYALALHDSLIANKMETKFAVFISKGNLDSAFELEIGKRQYFYVYNSRDLKDFPLAGKLKEKYSSQYHDAFRWGMKPVFINFLLQEFKKVIYVDSDIYFYGDYSFLFDLLDENKVLLTPHWRSSKPGVEYSNFQHNFRDGIYNAGFIGASRGAEEAMTWWANLILFKCEVNRAEGYYVDQRYLDIMPVLFSDVKALTHRGCNVANWNKVECKRVLMENGEVLINRTYPIIFIHFTNTMLTGIYYENDDLLKPYLIKYRDNLLKYSDRDIIKDYFDNGRFKKPRSEDDFLKKKNNTFQKKRILSESKTLLKKLFKYS